jgi:hypothetical protein
MAYVSQEMKSKLAPTIKAVLKKYKVKATIAVRNHSTLVVNIKEGSLDIIEDYLKSGRMTEDRAQYVRKHNSLDVNTYWIQDHFTGKSKKFLLELKDAMEGPEFFNEDDAQTDYFHRSHYIDINVGNWKKPYTVVAA